MFVIIKCRFSKLYQTYNKYKIRNCHVRILFNLQHSFDVIKFESKHNYLLNFDNFLVIFKEMKFIYV